MKKIYLSSRKEITEYLILIFFPIISLWQVSIFKFTLKNDMMDAYFPFRYFMGESIQNEIIPFWNPYIYLGYPFYSDPQSAFWYPISWILSLNGYSIFDLHFEFIIYFIFGGIGFYRLLKYFRITSWVALIFGISYQLSGFFIGSASLLTFLIGASFLPWSILYFYKLLSKLNINAIIGFVISISLILTGGYPAILIILMYILIFIFLFEIINQKVWTFQKFIPWLFNLAFSSILILILNAGYLYSIYQSSSWITRGQGISIESALYCPFPRKALISLIAPFASAFQNDILASDIAMTNVFVGLLMFVMLIGVMVACTAPLNAILDISKQSDNLNCKGFDYDGDGTVGNNVYDYNSSLSTDKVSCVAVDLAVPFIYLSIILTGVAALVMGRNENQASMLDAGV